MEVDLVDQPQLEKLTADGWREHLEVLATGRRRPIRTASPHEAGAASSLLNVTQQVGGSLGLSILVTVFGTPSRNEATNQIAQLLRTGPADLLAQFRQTGQLPGAISQQVLAHGISTAFQLAAMFAVLALVVALTVIQARPATVEAPSGLGDDT